MSSVNLVGITQPDYEYTGCTDASELVRVVQEENNEWDWVSND